MLSWEQGVPPRTQMGTYLIMNALSLTLLNFYFKHRIRVSTKVFFTFVTLAWTFEAKIISAIIIFKVGHRYHKLEQEITAQDKCILYTITHNW